MFEVIWSEIILLLFGLAVGSFLNVVIDRTAQGRSIWKGRSMCDNCHKKLSPLELIPIASYVMLGGRCKHCRAKIPSRLLVVELITGCTFVLLGFEYLQNTINFPNLFYLLVVSSLLISIFFIDLEYGIIPDKLNSIFVLVTLIYLLFFTQGEILSHIAVGICTFLFFFLLFIVTRGRGMGLGDVKYSFVMGLALGFPQIIAGLYIAFLTGAAISLILIVYGKKKLKSTVPFGPFLVTATFIAYLWGGQIMEIILRRFF